MVNSSWWMDKPKPQKEGEEPKRLSPRAASNKRWRTRIRAMYPDLTLVEAQKAYTRDKEKKNVL